MTTFLPVAFGVPAVLIGLLGVLNYIRGKKLVDTPNII